MISLAIDTAMNACSAALSMGGQGGCISKSEPMPRGHAERLVPLVDEVLAQAGIDYEALQAIVTTCGPGAFTGLRVGMSAAKAYGVALSIPVYGILTTDALMLSYQAGHQWPSEGVLAVVMETKRQDYYLQMYDGTTGDIHTEGPASATLKEGMSTIPKGALIIGDGSRRFAKEAGDMADKWVFSHGCDSPNPSVVVVLPEDEVGSRWLRLDPMPVYTRGADVSTPKRKPRKLEASLNK